MHQQGVDFFRHAAAIAELDVAAFAFALHELMGRQGLLMRSSRPQSSIDAAELWGNVTAGLQWMETLHELAPGSAAASDAMQNRLDPSDPDSLKRALELARNRAKWCGGLPLWLVVANFGAVLFCTLTAVVLLLRGPSVVDAGPPMDFATPAEVRALEERIDSLQSDHAFVVGRLLDRLERLQAEGQAGE